MANYCGSFYLKTDVTKSLSEKRNPNALGQAPRPPAIDKPRARKAFGRAAESYDEAAVLQREVGERMLARLDLMKMQPGVVLDLGSGTGVHAGQLLVRYPKSRVYAVDFSLPMLRKTASRGRWLKRPSCVCADMERLPIRTAGVDLLYSNLAFQWANDLPALFAECRRILKPGGLLMFSTFGLDTLKELRGAWSTVDDLPHVSPFMDMHDIGDSLLQSGFAEPVMDVDQLKLTYDTVQQLMLDLKHLGAHNAACGQSRGLTGKGLMQAMREAYEAFRQQGLLPASYEVVYGHAWMPQSPSAVLHVE